VIEIYQNKDKKKFYEEELSKQRKILEEKIKLEAELFFNEKDKEILRKKAKLEAESSFYKLYSSPMNESIKNKERERYILNNYSAHSRSSDKKPLRIIEKDDSVPEFYPKFCPIKGVYC